MSSNKSNHDDLDKAANQLAELLLRAIEEKYARKHKRRKDIRNQ
jgi:hypothetical protein